jgi:N-acyl-D-amino-acid deacylase
MPQTFNILVRNGHIVDGTGSPWYKADVAITRGRFNEIGKIHAAEASRVIDAEGLAVAPGFIDIHVHSDYSLLADTKGESAVAQGITTDFNGQCGGTPAPAMGGAIDPINRALSEYGLKLVWSTVSEYISHLQKLGPSINVATLVGHGTIRACVMGYANRPPTREELDKMKDLLKQSMEEGCYGMSTGLVYPPGIYSTTNELIELCRVVAEQGGLYASHVRGQGNQFLEAVSEALEIGEQAKVPVQLSHHSPNPGNFGKTTISMDMVRKARDRGVDVTCDLHSFHWGSTTLTVVLPPWAHEGGKEKMLERLRNKGVREKLKNDILGALEWPRVSPAIHAKSGSWSKILIEEAENRNLTGKSIEEIAKETGKDPFDAVFDVIIKEKGQVSCVYEAYSEEDRRNVLSTPWSMISTDGSAIAPHGPTARGKPHPKSYGTFPMIFRKYVRGQSRPDLTGDEGQKLLTLEEAVKKMTSMPATRIGLHDRGLIKPGFWADTVIFDPQKISDKGTYFQGDIFPEGIEYVLINGVITMERGRHTGAGAGQVLRFKPR